MFETSHNQKTVDVFISLTDGRELFGSLVCGLKAEIASALNGEGHFIELRDRDGDANFIGKHQIALVEKAKRGVRKQTALELAAQERSNWHEILGVSSTSDENQVKAAYHALAKKFHPDLYPDHFPVEMRTYATERFAQINKAYDAFLQLKIAA